MKFLKMFAVLAVLSTLFMGCPYSAELPIDEPTIKIDEKLLGKWEEKSGADYAYTITVADANTYKIEKKTVASGDVTIYKAYLSDVNGTRYLNLWEQQEGATTKTFYFYKLSITTSGSKVTLLSVTENIDEKFTTSKELKDFMGKNQSLSFFFAKDENVYIKAD